MGAAIRSLGVLLLGYPILLALVALVVLVGIVVILKVLVYDPIMAEQRKREAERIKQLQHGEWQRAATAARIDARAARRKRARRHQRKRQKRKEDSDGS